MGAALIPLKISLESFPPALQRLLHEAPATVGQHVEHVEEQRLRFRAVMLQEIERDPPVCIQGDDLAVNKGAGREPFAGLGDLRELVCEQISPPGPERYHGRIPASKTAVAVELNLVEPFLALGQALTSLAYIGSIKRILAGNNALKALGFTRSGVSDAFSVLLKHGIRPHQHPLRNRQTNLLRRLQVNYQNELSRTLHGQVGWLCTLQDFVNH